jgi:hypothetical protein
LRDKDIARMVRFQMRVNHENSFYEVRKLIHMAASDSESQLGEIAERCAPKGLHRGNGIPSRANPSSPL